MFNSLFGGYLFLRFFALGVIFGFIYEICKIVKIISKNNIFITNTITFVYMCTLGTCFCSVVLNYASASFKIYFVIACLLGVVLEQICIGFLFTKFYNLVYNVFIKIINWLNKTKFGKKVLR